MFCANDLKSRNLPKLLKYPKTVSSKFKKNLTQHQAWRTVYVLVRLNKYQFAVHVMLFRRDYVQEHNAE